MARTKVIKKRARPFGLDEYPYTPYNVSLLDALGDEENGHPDAPTPLIDAMRREAQWPDLEEEFLEQDEEMVDDEEQDEQDEQYDQDEEESGYEGDFEVSSSSSDSGESCDPESEMEDDEMQLDSPVPEGLGEVPCGRSGPSNPYYSMGRARSEDGSYPVDKPTTPMRAWRR